MPFPSTISTFTIVSASDRLNSPSHSGLHNDVSSVLTQVQTVIGVEGASSVVGSLQYLIKSPDSNGGGHVQTANKGGTGQTTFIKGDLLVASGTSVLTKLAVGLDGQLLTGDSSVATGVKWANFTAPGTKVATSASVISIITVADTTVLTTTIPGSTLGSSGAVKATVYISELQATTGSSILTKAFYGGGVVASVMLNPTAGNATGSILGQVRYTLIANNSSVLQKGILEVDLRRSYSYSGVTSSMLFYLYNSNSSSVQSSANQTMAITMKHSEVPGGNNITVDASIVEKIT